MIKLLKRKNIYYEPIKSSLSFCKAFKVLIISSLTMLYFHNFEKFTEISYYY
jgi:hypothetical protein